MASVYYNSFIVLILVFIHLFIQQTFIEDPLNTFIPSAVYGNYRGEYDEIPVDTEFTIQRNKKNQTLHELKQLYSLSFSFFTWNMQNKMPIFHDILIEYDSLSVAFGTQ